MVGVDIGGPAGIAELAIVIVVDDAVAVVVCPIGLVDEIDHDCLASRGLGLRRGSHGDGQQERLVFVDLLQVRGPQEQVELARSALDKGRSGLVRLREAYIDEPVLWGAGRIRDYDVTAARYSDSSEYHLHVGRPTWS